MTSIIRLLSAKQDYTLNTISENTSLIKQKALELGFDNCGMSPAVFLEQDEKILEKWLNNGQNAGMKWMENHREKRSDPRKLVKNARTVISLLVNYYNPEMQNDPQAPVLSRYAYGKDYHKIIKKRLKKLYSFICEIIPGVEGRFFVDSAPVLEHAFARNAGLGWIGKNSLLLNKELGSYFFISEIIINKELEYEEQQVKDFCGNCSLCIDECPTHAINPDRTVNAGKCISYLTIENPGDIPETFRNSMYNRVFGCDICQDVCPWNRKLKLHEIPQLNPSVELLNMTKEDWKNLSEEKYEKLFEGSAVKRAGFQGLRRNIDFLL